MGPLVCQQVEVHELVRHPVDVAGVLGLWEVVLAENVQVGPVP